MRERPVDIRDSDVAAALARQWALTVQDMSYLPVGFGGYHWLAVDQTGWRWFAPADGGHTRVLDRTPRDPAGNRAVSR